MNVSKTILAAAVFSVALSAPVIAQDTGFQLPKQCAAATAAGEMDHSAMGHGSMQGNRSEGMGAGMKDMMGMEGVDLKSMPEHVQENMRKMMLTMPAMHEGMMNENADVAFACGMIAHHQGAIDMAKVLLEYGKNPEMRALAEEIIAAQVGEIQEMTKWLAQSGN
jgi:uncharacterized protein (DUF305 family)